MMICAKCGSQLVTDANFCPNCGTQIVVEPVVQPASVTPVEVSTEPISAVVEPTEQGLSSEDMEFIENTRRLLRWEKKAWKITGIAFSAMGGGFGGLFLLLAVAMLAIGDSDSVALAIVYVVYAFIYAAMFVGIGIIQLIASKKTSYYLDVIDTDFAAVEKRCGSVGMIVFTGLFGTAPVVFFAINFARIKSCTRRIQHIIACQ